MRRRGKMVRANAESLNSRTFCNKWVKFNGKYCIKKTVVSKNKNKQTRMIHMHFDLREII